MNRNVLFTLAVILLMSGNQVIASGTRSVIVNTEKADRFRLLSVPEFRKFKGRLRYLGSTRQNHIFGLTRTAIAKGHPFDSVVTYRVPVKELALQQGWKIGNKELNIEPHRCPNAYLLATTPPSIFIGNPMKAQKKCINRTNNVAGGR